MKALFFKAINQPLSFEKTLIPKAGVGEAVVHLRAAALNYRDIWITQGQYAGIRPDVILGSDGAGEYKGKEVIINPSLNWGANPHFQSKEYHILGMPTDGTFAAFVKVPRANLHFKPAFLTWEQAAALPLAGVTAWRVLFTRCRLKRGERVLVTGIGGGVALFALQFAIAAGAEVWVTSSADFKINKAIALGAAGGANYTSEGWDKDLKQRSGGFDVVIDSAGGDGFGLLPGMCLPGARIGVYGGTRGKVNGLSPQILFWKQISILGSTMGTNPEFGAMLKFMEKHQLTPVVDAVFPLEQGNEAMGHLRKKDQFGKVVLRID